MADQDQVPVIEQLINRCWKRHFLLDGLSCLLSGAPVLTLIKIRAEEVAWDDTVLGPLSRNSMFETYVPNLGWETFCPEMCSQVEYLFERSGSLLSIKQSNQSINRVSKIELFKKRPNSQEKMSSQKVTPYQGRKRCFGEYACSGCGKNWKSANSHANEAQKCSNCKTSVYPSKQVSRPQVEPFD